MDPLSQAVVGATASQVLSRRKDVISASLLGFFSGMAADLDVVIRSPADPLLFLEYHRQFSHSLLFMPVGGLMCAVLFWLFYCLVLKDKASSFKRIYLYCTAGYATHGLLDACTSYGTQLFWPFSHSRVAWNNVSIIDPLFTLPLLFTVIIAFYKRSPNIAYWGAIYGLNYLSLGLVQHHRALSAASTLAETRHHHVVKLTATPSFANLLVWRSIYQHQDHYYVDGIRVGLDSGFYQGQAIKKLNVDRDFPWLDLQSQQATDIERFRWFTSDYLALDPARNNAIIDLRYSLTPHTLSPLWAIQLSTTAHAQDHIQWRTNRDSQQRRESIKLLWKMIQGKDVEPIAGHTND